MKGRLSRGVCRLLLGLLPPRLDSLRDAEERRREDDLARLFFFLFFFFSSHFFFSSSNKHARIICVAIDEKLNGPTWSTFLPRGIAKAGEPNNFLPMSPASLHMDPTVYATLRRKQRRLARENPGVLMAVARGANQAIAECQHQFRNRRWNCSTKNFLRGKNLFGKIVDRGEHRISFLFLRCFFTPRPIIWFVNCRSKIISAARASLIDVERYIRIPSFLPTILAKLGNNFAKAEYFYFILFYFISFHFISFASNLSEAATSRLEVEKNRDSR